MEELKNIQFHTGHRKYYDEKALDDISTGIHCKAYDFIYHENKDYLKQPAITYFSQSIDYEEMFKKIDEYAKMFKKYGVSKGDIVSICLANIPEVIFLKYALNRIGAISNMIEPRNNPESILHAINDTNSKLVISIADIYKSKFKPIKDKIRTDDLLLFTPADSIAFSGDMSLENLSIKSLYALKQKYMELLDLRKEKYVFLDEFMNKYKDFIGKVDSEYEENEAFSILYTSGTTDKAFLKGVVHCNESYNSMVKQGRHSTGHVERGQTFLGIIPFFSAYGSLCGMHNSLANGWNIYMIPKFKPSEYDLIIKKYKPNCAFAVPRMWDSLKENKRLQNEDLSYAKVWVCGGDKWAVTKQESANEFLKERGSDKKIKVGYGDTEHGGAVSTTLENYEIYQNGDVGVLFPGCMAIVVNPETKECLGNGIENAGELYLYSPSNMLGYYNQPKLTQEKIGYIDEQEHVFYKTGDKVYFDDQDRLHIIDRYKRVMMRPDGHTVDSTAIENVIVSHPKINACAVVGKQYEDLSGTIPTAFIVVDEKQEDMISLIDSVDELTLQKLPERNRALTYVVVDKLPYTLMGKVDFKKLEEGKLEELEYIPVDYTFIKKKGKSLIKK